jgi:hypothetical protein
MTRLKDLARSVIGIILLRRSRKRAPQKCPKNRGFSTKGAVENARKISSVDGGV